MIRYKSKLEKWIIRIAVALVISYLVVWSVVVLADDSEQHQTIQTYKTFRQTQTIICKGSGTIKLYKQGLYAVTEEELKEKMLLSTPLMFVSILKSLHNNRRQEWFFVRDKKGILVEWKDHGAFDFFLKAASTDFYRFAHGQTNNCKRALYVNYDNQLA